jgi:uncharacterized membrane protein YphA (DoxX/SURF4 family)
MNTVDILNVLQFGFNAPDAALTLNRLGLGIFFAGCGYYKLFNSARHAQMMRAMVNLHIPFPRFNGWFVSGVEFFGGLSLISGILAPFAALGLMATCIVAAITSAIPGITEKDHPLSRFDWLHYVFYKVEVLYCLGLAIVLLVGPGWTLVDWVLP